MDEPLSNLDAKLRLALLAAPLAIATSALHGQAPSSAPARGAFLVASRDLADPNFKESVVLLLDHGTGGSVGLVVNRPLEMRLVHVFPGIEPLKWTAQESGKQFFCGCNRTATEPFCDGTHKSL